ncbi:uncharacterized protein [Chelonus insularis]|uniref:uncharacterized protein n=1 Tax=Chelonus insularis TaxID=460826 RepID=UPI00158CBFFB|nr:uncharacterized protein LOC118067709 [Chelonus insularis]
MHATLTRVIKQMLLTIYETKLLFKIRTKMSCVPKKIVRCIGKCSSGLTLEELDNITDHIQKTLNDCKGRKIFREFLRQSNRVDDLACLDFYEKICEFIENDKTETSSTTQPSVKVLTENINEALDIAANLYGVPEIDMALLERFSECLTTPCRAAMLDVLSDTKLRLMDHLTNAHKDFRIYLLEPCPKTK